MRLWSIHPRYLDPKGLVALWREGLLAQSVLAGKTKGYKNHPQLDRFKRALNPRVMISMYLHFVFTEAEKRGCRFDPSKIDSPKCNETLNVTEGQVQYEWQHLLKKLKIRSPGFYNSIKTEKDIDLHPLFMSIPGRIEGWEVL